MGMLVGARDIELAYSTNQVTWDVKKGIRLDGMLLAEWECLIVISVFLRKLIDRFVADEQGCDVESVFGETECLVKVSYVCLYLGMRIFGVDFF
jgi:hypothetical protein